MAKIEFIGFVNETRESNGETWLLKTAETHRRDGENGERETTARTFRDVLAIRDSGVDLSQFKANDLVSIVGYESTVVSEHNGVTYYNLTVWANSVELYQAQDKPAKPARSNARAGQRQGNRR